MKRLLFLLLAFSFLLASCEQMRSTWHRHDRIAKVGKDILYESDLKSLLPQNISPEDSVEIVEKYINSWALSRIMLMKAHEELPKAEKDVSGQVEEFRNNLLNFRYEKYFLESRLDTIVTESEIQEYYDSHATSFTASYSVVKGRVIQILTKSPYYDMIKNGFTVEDATGVATLEELCNTSAEKYTDFGKNWVLSSTMAGEIAGTGVEDLEAIILRSRQAIIEQDGTTYFVFIENRVAPGELSPYGFVKERIREAIIGKRKQELLAELERDLLNDARTNKTLKLYDKK